MKTTSLTNKLIIFNIIIFFIVLIMFLIFKEKTADWFFLKPSDFISFKYPWTIVTHMFIHSVNFLHIFVNMLSLFFLGNFIERIIGKKRFFWLYMFSGIAGGLAYVLSAYITGQGMDTAAVGASGALFGIAGTLVFLTPNLPVYVMFIPIAMPLWFGVIFLLIFLWVVSALLGLPIGNIAHLGGFLFGVTYGIYLRLKYKKKVKALNLFLSRKI